MSDWPHQTAAVDSVEWAIASGTRRICLTSPTGGGKTRIACRLVERWVDQGHKVSVYSNRKMLIEQLSRVLNDDDIEHGVRAAGWEGDAILPVQISSIATENARVYRSKRWRLHPATRVLVDEAHLQTGEMAQKILADHLADHDAAYVGLTASPIGLADFYDHLVVAGTNSQLRACGAMVPCVHYAPDEPDYRQIELNPGVELEDKDVKAMMNAKRIFGRVIEHFRRLNPQRKPTILFAPGVEESVYFAQQFSAAGIPAAHIDGNAVWIDGTWYRSNRAARDEVLEGSKNGKIVVLCNRFVLREGIDAPWLAHGVFATVFRSVQSYLQSGGRLLRAYPGLAEVTIQDHGGNWWRHGSLNADREWMLSETERHIAGRREDAMRAKQAKEPFLCPQCGRVLSLPRCPCGWVVPVGFRKARPVLQTNGQLRMIYGDVFKPRRLAPATPDMIQDWQTMYFRGRNMKNRDQTFRAAEALFAMEHGWQWPDRRWPMMPVNPADFVLPIKRVPKERLYPWQPRQRRPAPVAEQTLFGQ